MSGSAAFGQEESTSAAVSTAAVAAPAPGVKQAKAPPGLGGGFMLGSPTGFTFKYWLNDTHALDAAVGLFDSNPEFHADFLFHGWRVFPQSPEGRMAAVLGIGGRFNSDSGTGIRGVLGASYILMEHPVEIFFELVPVLPLERSGLDLDGALGVRYYFTTF